MHVKPLPFEFTGIFSGTTTNGTLSIRLTADGTGLSCFQDRSTGGLVTGDAKYSGARIYTKDRVYTLKNVRPDQIKASSGFTFVILNRVDEAPSVCKKFLGQN
jgi:hypothetical protein